MSWAFEPRKVRWWAAGLAICVTLASPAHAADAENGATGAPTNDADPSARDEAAQRFEAAGALYAKGDYEAAAVELERAYALVPDPRVLYKLGKLWLHLQRHAQARRAFEKYLEETGAELSPESRAQVDADLQRLREKTAELTVNVNVPGSEVLVDDVSIGHTPLSRPLVLDIGERRVVVRKNGYATHEERVTLAGDEVRRLEAVLAPKVERPTRAPSALAERRRPAAPAPAAEPKTPNQPTLTWIAWSVTGVLAAGATTAGVLGLVATSELDSLKDDPDASRSELERHADRAELRLMTADILAGATLLAAGGALYLTFSAQRDTSNRPSHGVSLRVSPAAVTLATRF